VKSKPILATKGINPKFATIIKYIERLELLLKEIPPFEQKQRFGNKAFKVWHEKCADVTRVSVYFYFQISQIFLEDLLPLEIQGASIELKTYLMDSYGSAIRLDYGTGHEMAFIFFLFSLYILGLYGQEDFETLARNIFYK